MVGKKKQAFLNELKLKESKEMILNMSDGDSSESEIERVSTKPNKKVVIEETISDHEATRIATRIPKPRKARPSRAKPPVELKPYVFTEARMQNFIKAKQVRDENVKIRKEIKDKEDAAYKVFLDAKQAKKDKAKEKAAIKKEAFMKKQLESDTESESEEEVIVKPKKKAIKKKSKIYESSSEDDSDSEMEVKKSRSSKIVIINKLDKQKEPVNKPVVRRNMFL